MRVPPAVVLALAALALAGCETTQEKSARLERAAHRKGVVANAQGLKITSPSKTITVRSALALHTPEGTAAAVTLTNSAGAQREVPLLISVAQGGAPAVSNSEPGLARSLTSVAYVPAHGSAVWVDDQIALTGTPGAVTAKVGEGKPAGGGPPRSCSAPTTSKRNPAAKCWSGRSATALRSPSTNSPSTRWHAAEGTPSPPAGGSSTRWMRAPPPKSRSSSSAAPRRERS